MNLWIGAKVLPLNFLWLSRSIFYFRMDNSVHSEKNIETNSGADPEATGKRKKPFLEVRGLSISFEVQKKLVPTIRKVSYTLREGEVLGIVGESGSGKSISSNAIFRLLPDNAVIDGGEVIFEGQDLLKMPVKDLRKIRGNKIAEIFQDPMTSLDPLFTIGYQIDEVLKKHTEYDKEKRRQRMIELLELVGINQPERRLKQYPHEFSGGMRQRAMIAMALACEPKLLIADEPTTALDVTIQAQIIELLKRIKDQFHMSIIFITHDLGVVADICDRILVMYAGEVIESAEKRELFYNYQHPYTEGLLKSVPDPDEDIRKPLSPIEGNPPEMSVLGKECAFARRCPYAMKICAKEEPLAVEWEPGHMVRCYRTILKMQEAESGAAPEEDN